MTSTPSTYKYLPPQLADRLRNVSITVRQAVEGVRQGFHRSPHLGSSVEFAEYREYAPGDPPSLIDWAVYARSDRYMIRRFKEETNLRAHILLDASESLLFRQEGICSKMEYASHLAAGRMFILVNQGDSAGLTTFIRSIEKLFPPVATFDGLRAPLLALEDIAPSGQSDIEAALHQAALGMRSRNLVVIISDLLQAPERILRGVAHLRHDGHEVIVLHVLDGAERHLPYTGLAELRELETGDRIVIDVEEIRGAYIGEVERYLEELRAGCSECMAKYHLLDTRTPIDELLFTRIVTL